MSSLLAIPTNPSRAKSKVWIAAPAGAAVLLVLVLAYFFSKPASSGDVQVGTFERVERRDLEVTVKQQGELAAVNNTDIACAVEGNTTIVQIVPEGSPVTKGKVLALLDSSAIAQRIEDTQIELQKAEASVINARELRDIQLLTNSANLDAASVDLRVAKLDLQAYVEGSYPQQLDKAKTDLELSKVTLKNKEETLANTRNLFNKGFVTAADLKTAEQDVVKAQFDVAANENGLNVLAKYAHESDMARKQSAVAQAEQKFARVKRESASNLNQRNADLASAEQNYQVIDRRMTKLKDQLAACTIVAPSDGMVVYGTTGDRDAQNQIQEGSSVRERQVIFRLPDSSAMKVVVRANETQVVRLREGQPAKISIGELKEPLVATVKRISPLPASGGRWWDPDRKEFPVDIVLDKTPPGLRPGTGAKVEVLVSRSSQVMTVPLTTIYFAGAESWVFLRDGADDAKPAKVKLGQLNDKYAEILEGVEAGQEVKVLAAGEGQTILGKFGIKVSTTQPGREWAPGAIPGSGPPSGAPGGGRRRGGPGGAPGGGAPTGVPGGQQSVAPSPSTPIPSNSIEPRSPATQSASVKE